MSEKQEAVVHSLLAAISVWDQAGILGHFSDDATYRVTAWQEPLEGRAAIAAELERQAGVWSGFRYDEVAMASTDSTVFSERVDTITMAGREVHIHTTSVFDIDEAGRITSWRDYFDMKEVEAQLAG